ncbi:MAG: SDR family NAD(P)-dependent oxidoreductase [Bacteroidales bacterium]|nr:SDR family NAD(P)-dependent oxidoreductase [Bacteroidales bacterium]
MSQNAKVILVTGASSGIGFDTAQRLAAMGHKVYAAARRVELMEPLRNDGVEVLSLDVTNEQSMSAAIDTILTREGRIDVLFNNAGYGYFGAVEQVAMAEARRQLEVNVFGLARLCQLVIPIMRRQGSGRIVNTSSIAGRSVFLFGGWYNVSKYSVEALSDAMRIELKPYGIDVVMVEPGPIRTDWGIIAARHLRESSADTPYAELGSRWANTMDWGYTGNLFSGPDRVAAAACRAITARRPRARYVVGRYARLTLALHALLPTRWWDAAMRRAGTLRLGGKNKV